MENREMVYKLAKTLDMLFEVWKDDVLVGVYKFVDDKLIKIK